MSNNDIFTTIYAFRYNPYLLGELFFRYILDKTSGHVRGVFLCYFHHFVFILKTNAHLSYANTVNPDLAASDPGLHCLLMSFLRATRNKWVKVYGCPTYFSPIESNFSDSCLLKVLL